MDLNDIDIKEATASIFLLEGFKGILTELAVYIEDYQQLLDRIPRKQVMGYYWERIQREKILRYRRATKRIMFALIGEIADLKEELSFVRRKPEWAEEYKELCVRCEGRPECFELLKAGKKPAFCKFEEIDFDVFNDDWKIRG